MVLTISMKKLSIVFAFLLFSCVLSAQTLIINEVSNGSANSEEYVELLVAGTTTCGVNSTLDIRNFYIDDNNGTHASGSGTGIATGCVRFRNIAFWQNIPIGTIILIYNNVEKNTSITLADDVSLVDGNSRLIIPMSHTLLETNTVTPSSGGSATYPTTGFTVGGNWTTVGMANGGDSFHTVDAGGNIIFAVSYSNNNMNNDIYFAASQTGKVIYNANVVDNNYLSQANWVNVSVTGNETPGLPNNTANAAWINSMLSPTLTTFSVSANNESICSGGTAILTATPTTAGGTYTWSPGGANTQTISVSPNSTTAYTVMYTLSGCTTMSVATVSVNSNLLLNAASPSVCPGQTTTLTVSGGVEPYTWSHTASTSSVVVAGAGTYTVSYSGGPCGLETKTISVSTIPDPVLSLNQASYSVCAGSPINVVASSSENNYSWSGFPTNNTATLTVSPSTTFSSVVTTTNICTSTSLQFNVDVTPIPTVSITPASIGICPGQTVTLQSTVNTPVIYTWSTGESNDFIDVTFSGVGVYTVNVSNICSAASATAEVYTPGPLPNVFIEATPAVLCPNSTVTLEIKGSTGSYTWNTGTTGTNSITVNTTGIYTATLTNICGTRTPTIQINSLPDPAVTITPNSATLCPGGVITLTATGNTGNYLWNSAETSSVISVNTPGVKIVSVTNACGTAIDSANISNINFPPLALTSNSLTICSGEVATLTVTGGVPLTTGSPIIYNWSNNSTNTSSVQTTTGGVVTVSNTNVCNTQTASINVSVTVLTADILANPTSGSDPLLVNFTDNSTGAITYNWNFGNGAVATTQTVSPQTYNGSGSYWAYLAVANGACVSKDSILITVELPPEIIIPNVFTPNNDNVNDVFKITALNIKEFNCTIYDRWGLKMFYWEDVTKGWDGKKDGKNVPDGTYFYILYAKDIDEKEINKQGSVNLFK